MAGPNCRGVRCGDCRQRIRDCRCPSNLRQRAREMASKPLRGADKRIAYGAGCTWWDSIAVVSIMAKTRLPCCPHCGGLLYEVDSLAEWTAAGERHEKSGHPGYAAFLLWLRGKCFKTTAEARSAYEKTRAIPEATVPGDDA